MAISRRITKPLPVQTDKPVKVNLVLREDVPIEEARSALRLFANEYGNPGTGGQHHILWSSNMYNCGWAEWLPVE